MQDLMGSTEREHGCYDRKCVTPRFKRKVKQVPISLRRMNAMQENHPHRPRSIVARTLLADEYVACSVATTAEKSID